MKATTLLEHLTRYVIFFLATWGFLSLLHLTPCHGVQL